MERVEADGLDIHMTGFTSEDEMHAAMEAVDALDSSWGVTAEMSEGAEVGEADGAGDGEVAGDTTTSTTQPPTTEPPTTEPPTTEPPTTEPDPGAGEGSTGEEGEAGEETDPAQGAGEEVPAQPLEALFILAPVEFEYLSSQLREESNATLDTAAEVIKANPDAGRIRVVGHADSLGPSEPNLRLSERRAQAVADYLVKVGGVDAGRLEIEGRGETELLVEPELTAEDAQRNRRAEWELLG